ncbi:MAG: histidine kinase [Deltaproteobacteria bacterium]|nr:histidine kinase [Deltaproteobacteria bacterium]
MISFFKKKFIKHNVTSLIAYIPIWILIAVLSAILFNIDGISLLNSFILSLFFCVPFSVISYSARYVCRVMPIKDMNFLHFPAHTGTAIAISAIMSGLTIMVSRVLPELEQLIIYNNIGILFIAGVTGHVVSIIFHYLVIAVKDNIMAEKKMDEARLLKRDAELKAIRAQLDPHFLFNSLNSISALIPVDGNKAREMVLLLSEFFRRTISSKAHDTITLKEEIDFVKGYLQIEKIRFGDRMDVEIAVDEQSESAMIPVFYFSRFLKMR